MCFFVIFLPLASKSSSSPKLYVVVALSSPLSFLLGILDHGLTDVNPMHVFEERGEAKRRLSIAATNVHVDTLSLISWAA